MSHNLAANKEFPSSAHSADDAQALHIGLRLRAIDQSDRAVVANISGVHLGSGFAFIDFGFVEQSALLEVARAARAGEQQPVLEGRLECRIAMGLGELAQLARHIDQVISSASKSPAAEALQPADARALDPAINLQ